ncbi:MAG: ATP-binding protein, partial [Lachnospiraceae bacterium]|nr:ATP-binding protein [Lachnospiraceae bacterium]
MTILRDLSVLWSLFHILILFIMLYRSRYGRRKTIFLTVITMGPIIIINIAGLILYGAEAMGQAFILTCTLPSLIVFWIISIDKKGRFFFTFCFADTIALWIIVVTNLLDFYFGGGQYVLMFIGRLLLFPLVEWWAIRYLRKPYLELQESVAEGWGIFAGMMALYYILLVVKANFP